MSITRRAVLLAAIGLAACQPVVNVTVPVTPADVATLIANGVAALTTLLPPLASPEAVATVNQSASKTAMAAAAINASGAGADIVNAVEAVAPLVIRLLPPGSKGAVIAQAIVAMLPALASLLHLTGVPLARPALARVPPMTEAQARAVLTGLTPLKYLR